MLRINRQTDYASRVLLFLSIHGSSERQSSAIIQKEMKIPQAFMARIVAHLANTKLIKTFTGRDGGIQLARPSNEITLKDVIEAFEGPLILSDCMKRTEVDRCPLRNKCPLPSKLIHLQTTILRELSAISFADLANEAKIQIPDGVFQFDWLNL